MTDDETGPRTKVRLAMLASALLTAGGVAWLAAGGASPWIETAARAPDLARGERIYAEACASCHGADLEGEPDWRRPGPNGRAPAPPHDETGHTWHHPDRVLLDIVRLGSEAVVGDGYESDMPGFAEVYSDEDLVDVLEWIKTRWPERERAFQARITAQDEALR